MKSQFSNSGMRLPGDDAFQVNQTLFGYVLRSKYTEITTNGFVGKIRKVLGVSFLLAIIGLWLSPNTILGAEIMAIKLLLSALYVALGVVLLGRGRQHGLRELQVDLKRGELRTGFRCRKGMFHLEGMHAFEDVDAVSIWNPEANPGRTNLLLRLSGRDVAIVAAQGERSLLEPYRTQLAKDLCAHARGAHPTASIAARSTTPLLLAPRIDLDGVAV